MSEEFILNTRAEDVINEAIVACRGLADNFSSLPVVEYVCSAIFLKMTGLLEQKFRAMVWVIQRNKSFHSINPWQAVYAFSLSFKKGQDTLFDEQFQGFGLEDWEFAYRLSKIHGYSITFDPSIKTTQYDDFKRTQNPFKNLNQNDINLYIKNALYFIEKYPEDKCLHKDLIKFVSKFAYSQKNQKFERIYVDFDELSKKDVNDIIKNYALLTKYKSKLK